MIVMPRWRQIKVIRPMMIATHPVEDFINDLRPESQKAGMNLNYRTDPGDIYRSSSCSFEFSNRKPRFQTLHTASQ